MEPTRIPHTKSTLTAEQVAAAVVRHVPKMEHGKPVTENGEPVLVEQKVHASDVEGWAAYPDTEAIVVVTTAGEKLVGVLPKAAKKTDGGAQK